MAVAERTRRTVAVKKQTGFNTPASGAGAQLLRRTSIDVREQRATIASDEVISSLQQRDVRQGSISAPGTLTGRLSPLTYADLMASGLRKALVAGSTSGAQVNVTAAAGPPGTFTRGAGSWITDGFRVGDVVRWTGWLSPATANNATNMRITALSATVMTVAETVVARAAGDSVTVTAPGKRVWVPGSLHTADFWTLEDFFGDIAISHVYEDVAFGGFTVSLQPDGLAEVSFPFLGSKRTRGTAAVFTSPAAETSTGLLSSNSGFLRLDGADSGLVTALSLSVLAPPEALTTIFSKSAGAISRAGFAVSGNITVGFDGDALPGLFDAESEFELHVMGTASPAANADFVSFFMPRVKLGEPVIADSGTSQFVSAPFTALEKATTTGYEATTITVQDSLA